VYFAYDENGMNQQGQSYWYSSSIFRNVAANEYVSRFSYPLKWLAGGELEWKPLSLEIQKNLSHFYFNRIFGSVAYRWTVFDETLFKSNVPDSPLLHSLVFRLGSAVSITPLTVLPLKLTFNGYATLKLSALGNNFSNDDWDFGWTSTYLLSY
jgi:hypothetical protein